VKLNVEGKSDKRREMPVMSCLQQRTLDFYQIVEISVVAAPQLDILRSIQRRVSVAWFDQCSP
jgi:hypothetical protein